MTGVAQRVLAPIIAGALAGVLAMVFLGEDAINNSGAYRAGIKNAEQSCKELDGDELMAIPMTKHIWNCQRYQVSGVVTVAVVKMERDGDKYKIIVRK